jgi:hypothetical protein
MQQPCWPCLTPRSVEPHGHIHLAMRGVTNFSTTAAALRRIHSGPRVSFVYAICRSLR